MRFPLTEQLLAEADRFQLRSACRDCLHHRLSDGGCSLDWPNQDQKRWPLDHHGPGEPAPREAHFCKEFELA